jgi:hypothetical protein
MITYRSYSLYACTHRTSSTEDSGLLGCKAALSNDRIAMKVYEGYCSFTIRPIYSRQNRCQYAFDTILSGDKNGLGHFAYKINILCLSAKEQGFLSLPASNLATVLEQGQSAYLSILYTTFVRGINANNVYDLTT